MRRTAMILTVLVSGLLAGCAQPPAPLPPPIPLSVGNGMGSQYGNYAARQDGEMRGPAGERCVLYNWDRPLTADLAIRLRSASCESQERPGWMISREISRTIIPLSESNLKDQGDDAP